MAVVMDSLSIPQMWHVTVLGMCMWLIATTTVFTSERGFFRKFGQHSKGNGELSSPTGICIDNNNVVYVAEWGNHRVIVFTCEGKFLMSFSTQGSGPGQFKSPSGVAIDKDGVVHVSDTDNNRLQLF